MFGAAKPALGFRKCCGGKVWDFLILFLPGSCSCWIWGGTLQPVAVCPAAACAVDHLRAKLSSGFRNPACLRHGAPKNLVEGRLLCLQRQLFNVVGNVVVPVELNKLRIPRGIQVLTWEPFLKGFLLASCWFSSPTADGRLQVD